MNFLRVQKFSCRVILLVLILSTAFIYNTYGQKLSTKGRLIGTVSNESNEKLVGATVVVSGAGTSPKTTDINGEFEFDIEPGTYSLTISYSGFETASFPSIIITKAEVTRHPVTLRFKTSEAVVVTGTRRSATESISGALAIQKNNSAVSDVMSTEQIKRTPDVTVSDAMRRMNGVTVIDNKFVVVRGMGERYNTTLLNGSQLPGTEPNKKNFSFDILPANIIDNIVVNKTATPDLPADFSGGLVQVTTKEVPDKNSFSFSAGAGYNTISTGRNFSTTKIEQGEYFAKVADSRKWYMTKWNPGIYFPRSISSPRENDKMNSLIPNNWGLYSYTAMPMQNYQFTLGLRKKFKNRSSLGFLLAGSYRNNQTIEKDMRQNGNKDSVSGRIYEFTTDIGGLASLSYNLGSNKFTFRTVYSRKLNHLTNLFSGYNSNADMITSFTSYLNYVDLLQNRFEAEHIVSPLKIRIKWYADISVVNRDLPDGRATERLNNKEYNFSDFFPQRGGVSASFLDEKRKNAGADISIPLKFINRQQSIKIGYLYSKRTVDYSYTFLRYLIRNLSTISGLPSPEQEKYYYGMPIDQLLTPETLLNGYIVYAPVSASNPGGGGATASDVYFGDQVIHSTYLMGDFNITEKIRIIGGARYEGYNMNIQSVTERDSITYEPKKTATTEIPQKKLYPSVNLVYKLTPKTNIRLAYSQTVARPEFRDVIRVGYYDFNTLSNVFGNDSLKNTRISNYDLRFEFFPKADEVVSATIFYKRFEDPIETNVRNDGSGNFEIKPVNLRSSTNLGIEIDFRKSLSFISSRASFFRKLYAYGNFSYMKSEVELDPRLSGSVEAEVRKRPLQGLSPYSINGGILFDGDKIGFNITYNRFGRRLVYLGDRDFEDRYENPRNVIDAQLFARFLKKKLEIKLNVSDLLNNPYIIYSNVNDIGNVFGAMPNDDLHYDKKNDYQIRNTIKGTSLSFSINYKF